MEGFNGNIRMARFLPTTAMMEYIFYKTMKMVDTHHNKVEDCMQRGEEFCARTNAMITKIQKKASTHKVISFSRQQGIFSVSTHRYVVKGHCKGNNRQNVNIQARHCTCGKWASNHMPCSHAVAGCMKNGINWKQWIEPYHYTVKLQALWEPMIYPLEQNEFWNYALPRDWQSFGTLKADERLRKMRKKRGDKGQSVRIRTEMDQSRSGKKCRACGKEGHTKRSKDCPMRLPRA